MRGLGVKKVIEKLADIEHQRWADWQAWCHKVLRENCPSPELEKVLERWDKQIATTYKDLTEKEKDSDRDQVKRYWPIFQSLLSHQRKELYSLIDGIIFDDKKKNSEQLKEFEKLLAKLKNKEE